MEVHCSTLIPGKKYYVETDRTERYIGEFWGFVDAKYNGQDYYGFKHVRRINTQSQSTRKIHTFYRTDKYYEIDIDEIKKNAENARKQLETRSVNMILKRLVNEEFQWQ